MAPTPLQQTTQQEHSVESQPMMKTPVIVHRLAAGVEIKTTRRLGDAWELKEQIGSGSYGVVWLGVNPLYPGDKVAVKVVDLRLLKKTSEREALKRESVLHAALSHENVVNLFEIWESDYEVAFVMEYVDGGSLFDFLTAPESNDHALSSNARRFKVHREESRVQILFAQMLESIDHLHKNLVVHRDLKLENFLVSRDCRTIKLCDFGLSSTYTPNSLMKASCGSPLYVPPEVLLGVSYDPRKADLWSLGITLFAVIFRKMPFLDQKNQLVLEYALRGVHNLPPALAKRVSVDAHDVLCKLLEPDPANRTTVENLLNHPWVLTGKRLLRKEQEELTALLHLQLGGQKPKRRPSLSFLRPLAASTGSTNTGHYTVAAPAEKEKVQEECEAVKPSFLKQILKARRKNSI